MLIQSKRMICPECEGYKVAYYADDELERDIEGTCQLCGGEGMVQKIEKIMTITEFNELRNKHAL